MSTALGSGLEMFRYLMDVEAEANVSIKSSDDDSAPEAVDMEPAEAEATVEADVAEDEKMDEDLENSQDELDQTSKAMSYVMDEITSMQYALDVMKRHGVDSSLYAYMNSTANLEAKLRKQNSSVPAVEALAHAGDAQKQLIISATEAAIGNAWERVKTMAKKIWEGIVKMMKAFIVRLTDARAHLESLKNKMIVGKGASISAVTYSKGLGDVKIAPSSGIINAANDVLNLINNALKGKLDTGSIDINTIINNITQDLGNKTTTVGADANLKNKDGVIKVIDAALSLDPKAYKEALKKAEENLKDSEKSPNGNEEQNASVVEALQRQRIAYTIAVKTSSTIISSAIRIANVFIKAAGEAASSDTSHADTAAGTASFDITRDIEGLVSTTEQFSGFSSSISVMATEAIDWQKMKTRVMEFLQRIKDFISRVFNKVIDFVFSQKRVLAGVKDKLGKTADTGSIGHSYYGQDKVLDYADVTTKLTAIVNLANKTSTLPDPSETETVAKTVEFEEGQKREMSKGGYNSKKDVEKVIDLAISAVDAVQKFKTFRDHFTKQIDTYAKELKKEKYDEKSSQHADVTKWQKEAETMSNFCKTIVAKVPAIIAEAIRVGRAWIHVATASEDSSKKKESK